MLGPGLLPGVGGFKTTVVPFTWTALPIHPDIAAKPESGRLIHQMFEYNGAVLVGYGDWTINTGVTKVLGHYVDTGEPLVLFHGVPSEAISRFRVFDGVMYIPWIDPTAGNQGGMTTNEGGTWHNENIAGSNSMVHTFDIIKYKGSLYACGSWSADNAIGHGVVYKRGEDGVWTQVMLTPSFAPMTRLYTFEVVDGNLTTREYHDGTQTRLWTSTSGLDWMPGPWSNIADGDFKIGPMDPTPPKWFHAPPQLYPLSTPLNTVDPLKYPGVTTSTHIWTPDPVTPGRILRTPL